jgi:8-oxo-dGTP pyrophosphatase MutT (NUDIX family)
MTERAKQSESKPAPAMKPATPQISARRVELQSPFIRIVARDVMFAPGEAVQTYHAVEQADYVSILALTPDRKIPLVRQYRPAIERFTWELPAGLVDDEEDPAESARRELEEETGLRAVAVHALGTAFACPGRLGNRIHSFFVEAGAPPPDFQAEPGMEVKYLTEDDLLQATAAGDISAQLQVGTLLQALLRGHLSPSRLFSALENPAIRR